MSTPQVFTYCDAVQELEEFAREASISAAERSVRGAVRRAYREIVTAHDWTCTQTYGRLLIETAQTTGTVTYDHTGGTYERQLTLTGDTWPATVTDWSVQIETSEGFVLCDIDERKSDTVVTLKTPLNPQRDIAAGASYVAFPRFYRLPDDFGSIDQPVDETFSALGQYVTPSHMMELTRRDTLCANQVRFYTISGAPGRYGGMAIFLDSYFTETKTIDFIYKRKPRDLRYVGKDSTDCAGTITVVADSASVAGVTTAFTADHVGSLLRIGTSTSKMPTGIDGLSPYAEQHVITARTSATDVTLAEEAETSRAGVKYAITDPLDLDATVYDAMMALAKKYLAAEKNAANWRQLSDAAAESLFRAKCGDNRVTQRRFAGARPEYRQRLADTPRSWRTEIA